MFQSKFILAMVVILFATATYTMASRFTDGDAVGSPSSLSKFSLQDLFDLMAEKRYPSRLADTMARRHPKFMKDDTSSESESAEHRRPDSETKEETAETDNLGRGRVGFVKGGKSKETDLFNTVERRHVGFVKGGKSKETDTMGHEHPSFRKGDETVTGEKELSTVSI